MLYFFFPPYLSRGKFDLRKRPRNGFANKTRILVIFARQGAPNRNWFEFFRSHFHFFFSIFLLVIQLLGGAAAKVGLDLDTWLSPSFRSGNIARVRGSARPAQRGACLLARIAAARRLEEDKWKVLGWRGRRNKERIGSLRFPARALAATSAGGHVTTDWSAHAWKEKVGLGQCEKKKKSTVYFKLRCSTFLGSITAFFFSCLMTPVKKMKQI